MPTRNIQTKVGLIHEVEGAVGLPKMLWECPKCGRWHDLDDLQWNGEAPIVCTGLSHGECDYNETHVVAEALYASEREILVSTRGEAVVAQFEAEAASAVADFRSAMETKLGMPLEEAWAKR